MSSADDPPALIRAADNRRAWHWLASEPVIAIVAGLLVSEGVIRVVRVAFEQGFEPTVYRCARTMGLCPPSQPAPAALHMPSSQRVFRVVLAVIECLALVGIAYLLVTTANNKRRRTTAAKTPSRKRSSR